MSEKILNTRIIQKHDTSENWAKATNFIPKNGEIIVYEDLNKIKIGNGIDVVEDLSFIYDTKADINNPNFTGIPTINNKEIATKEDIVGNLTADSEDIVDNEGTPGVHTTFYVSDEAVTDFTVMNGHKGERGISLLHIQTAPWANIHQTPDKLVHTMGLNETEVKREAYIDNLYLGDLVEWNGFLYQIAYLGDPQMASLTGQGSKIIDVYVDSVGNIKGPQGIQGIQGLQGPQGPKGDPGEGYFIVTDEDYAKIADFIEEKSYHSYQRPNASEPIRPNIFYDFGPQYQLEITFEAPQSIYRSNEYMFQFESPSDRPTTLIMPSSVRWCYDPVIEAGKTYQVSVLNDLAVICGA